MKEVTLHLSNRLQDPESGKSAVLTGVKLTGNPVQVGLIFECLRKFKGSPDIPSIPRHIKILEECQEALKRARQADNEYGELEDPKGERRGFGTGTRVHVVKRD